MTQPNLDIISFAARLVERMCRRQRNLSTGLYDCRCILCQQELQQMGLHGKSMHIADFTASVSLSFVACGLCCWSVMLS